MALIEYEKHLTEQAKDPGHPKGPDARRLLETFIGSDGACSVIAAKATADKNAATRDDKRKAKAAQAAAAAPAATARAAAPMGSSSASDGRRARNKPVLFKPG